MNILITGGAGYIGSHACVSLAKAGHELVILDNLCNSGADVIDRLATLCGSRPAFVRGDIRDATILDRLFADHPISAVMHFAGLKAVGEIYRKAARLLRQQRSWYRRVARRDGRTVPNW